MITFHTPKLPPPLTLDLASLRGGGSCPTQFEGETYDGRAVYVRYRGGWLSVDIANEPGQKPYDGTQLLDIELGPRLDGTIGLATFCRWLGVTVNGAIPVETNYDADEAKDLSGQTTFFRLDASKITLPTARRLLSACCTALPHALLVQAERTPDPRHIHLVDTTPDAAKDRLWLIDGVTSLADIDLDPDIGIRPKPGQLQIRTFCRLFSYPNPWFTSFALPQAEKALGRPLWEAGIRNLPPEHAIACDSFSLTADFPTADTATRQRLTALGEQLQAILPHTRHDWIDLATGAVTGRVTLPLDPVLADWCAAAPDRWLHIDRENDQWRGLRPAQG